MTAGDYLVQHSTLPSGTTRTLTSSSGTAPTASEVADAVWAKVLS